MKKAILSILLAAPLALSVTVFCQESHMPGLSPEVEKREKLLLQRLSPAQLQKVNQCVALFEGQPDPGAELQGALDRIFGQAGIAGMDESEAAFIVLSMATKDMDEDVKEIMIEIKAMTAAKQRMRELIEELNRSIAGATSGPVGSPGGRPRVPFAQSASLNAEPRQTAHFKIGFWKFPPLAAMDVRSMPLQQKIAESEALKSKLAELEDLQGRMSSLLDRQTQRRLKFAMELEGRALKVREKPVR